MINNSSFLERAIEEVANSALPLDTGSPKPSTSALKFDPLPDLTVQAYCWRSEKPPGILHVRGLADVNVHGDHVNVGFFYGAPSSDPAKVPEGTDKRGRHVTPWPFETVVAAPSAIEVRFDGQSR